MNRRQVSLALIAGSYVILFTGCESMTIAEMESASGPTRDRRTLQRICLGGAWRQAVDSVRVGAAGIDPRQSEQRAGDGGCQVMPLREQGRRRLVAEPSPNHGGEPG